jgi:L-iditol 2-dehydrogenase
VTSYSCGPADTREAHELLVAGKVASHQLVSHFISLDELPTAYQQMKRGEILKAMVGF